MAYEVDFDIVDSNGNIYEYRDQACYSGVGVFHRRLKQGFARIKHKFGEPTHDIDYVRCYLRSNLALNEHAETYVPCFDGDWDAYIKEIHLRYIQMLNSVVWLRPHMHINLKDEQYVDLNGDIQADLAISAFHLIRASAEYPHTAVLAYLLEQVGLSPSDAIAAATVGSSVYNKGKAALARNMADGHSHGDSGKIGERLLQIYDGSLKPKLGSSTMRHDGYGNSSAYLLACKGFDKLNTNKRVTEKLEKAVDSIKAEVDVDRVASVAATILKWRKSK